MRALAAGLVAGVIATASIVTGLGHAQPAPDVERAKSLYKSAETAMAEGRFADAARDFGAAYDITRDPVLFYKIGNAHERAGKCDIALIYYGRYLREARPNDQFMKLVQERIAACGGDPRRVPAPPDAGSGSAVGSAGSASGSGSGFDVAPVGSGSGSAIAAGSGSAVIDPVPDPVPTGSGSAAPLVVPPRHRVAWLLVGGSIASFTIGAVLAYSANAAENDINDLYVGLGGTPPTFNPTTKARYDELIKEGERYQTFSLIAFGVAGALAVTAAIRFATAKPAETTVITPTVSPKGAGVSATWRF